MKFWSQLLDESLHVTEADFRKAHPWGVIVQVVADPAMWQSNPSLLIGRGPVLGGAAAGNPLDPLVFELAPPPGKERVVVGRSRTADLSVPLSRISKQHAWFGFSSLEHKHFVSDMGSKNGTVVRGERLTANFATQLGDGDELLLGPYPFVFHTPEGLYAALRREAELAHSQEDTRAALLSMKTDVLPITPLGRGLDDDLLERDTSSRRNAAVPRSSDDHRSADTRTHDSGYEVVKRLGQGGMADVVLARRQGPGGFAKEMAIKRLLPEFASDRTFLDMFMQEARLAARINHPNVVQIYELGADDGSYFIAMEYVLGWDLSTIIKRARRLERPLPLEVVCRTGADICAGLHAAHTCVDEEGRSLQIVHRDVSPHNVMVSMPGISKITDFGISKAADSVRRTRPGELKGKLVYMAPEQVDDSLGDVSPRTDIFAAGLCLYEMLTFDAPFKRGSEMLTIEAVLKANVPDVREKRPDVPEALAVAIQRALAREQDDRFTTALELQLALERAAQTLPEPATATRCSEWLSGMSAAKVGEDGLPDPRHRTKSSVAPKVTG